MRRRQNPKRRGELRWYPAGICPHSLQAMLRSRITLKRLRIRVKIWMRLRLLPEFLA
jgi:hypothetical protein